ncbi:polyhydroxybutyrate depolymerase [uncultured Roseobacter sp.]|uniref:alpha/beta hydrolase family esterase n=1 Tax=uncultured Roseobacter sp. TaxID=114847 RepID=UPI0026211241|nr:polyhydroxybutyrate depolymerase [uncultured Roseobacter sp.]
MKLLFLVLSSLFFQTYAVFAMGPTQDACTDQTPCRIGDRSYHVKLPDDWDGVTPMPVLLHFHGWQRQGSLIVRHQRISGATRRRGVLLVAPNGLGRSWDFWRAGTPDVAFARAVLEDVRKTYPVIDGQIFVSGYSWGSNMAWRFVCEDGADVAALLAISGTLSQAEDCATAPGQVRQVYGLNDQVLDFPFGPGGDTEYPVYLWREKFGCGAGTPEGPWNARDFLTFRRTTWDCDGGSVSLDIHPGGHFIPHGWIARQLDQILGLPYSYP